MVPVYSFQFYQSYSVKVNHELHITKSRLRAYILNMQKACSSKTSIHFQHTTRWHACTQEKVVLPSSRNLMQVLSSGQALRICCSTVCKFKSHIYKICQSHTRLVTRSNRLLVCGSVDTLFGTELLHLWNKYF